MKISAAFCTGLFLCLPAWTVLAAAGQPENGKEGAAPVPVSMEQKGTLLATFVPRSQGFQTRTITNSSSQDYFRASFAEEGVLQIIKAGQFFVNGFPVPRDAAELDARWPHGYQVNGSSWLTHGPEGFTVDKKVYREYGQALLALVRRIPAGLPIRLYDTDGDLRADRIEASVLEAVIPQHIRQDPQGSFRIRRLAREAYPAPVPGEGRKFDGEHFTNRSREIIPPSQMDSRLAPGEIGLFAYGPQGWSMQRALPVTGALEEAKDHEYYQINGIRYQDAMRFSRDNLPISNRCGEFINTLTYFGLTGTQGVPVTLWLVDTGNPAQQGAPAGFTSGFSAPLVLTRALGEARAALRSVPVSQDGRDVPSGSCWMTPQTSRQLKQIAGDARESLREKAPSTVMDYESYLLYLALHGSQDDIGARYAGYHFSGIRTGTGTVVQGDSRR